MNEERRKEAVCLVENAEVAYISSVDGQGYPNIKAVLTHRHEGIAVHYFSTNTSAKRTQWYKEHPKACLYFCHSVNGDYRGLMLVGEIEVRRDKDLRDMLWHDGYEIYYPRGADDEDYSVLKFTAFKGNYYHGLSNDSFTIEEFEKI